MRVSTVLVIVGMFILSLYALIEVSFYASEINIKQKEPNVPILEIPSINLTKEVNNKSVFYGVYHEPRSFKPGNGTVILFGHRTMYGSPFFKLDKLKKGDKVYLNWPGIGMAEYTVNKSFTVPASYLISIYQGDKLFLITCHPIGSMSERLIVECDLVKISPFQKNLKVENPKNYYALLIIGAFFGGGLIVTRIYPVKEDRKFIFMATAALTLFLFFGYLFPTPPEFIAEKLGELNNIMGFWVGYL
ncbi:MAG: sortase [Methanothermobacter sp.]|nr:sortase [Methanothermobacter sp.]